MSDPATPDNKDDKRPEPGGARAPKRGAIPSPRADIDKAPPYVPAEAPPPEPPPPPDKGA